MSPNMTYISLGISPNADALVLQAINRDSNLPSGFSTFAHTISIAELDSFGHADAVGTIGQFALRSMSAYYPVISVFADALIPRYNGKLLTIEPPDHSGSKRDRHLRIKAIVHKEKSVVIGRFNNDDAAGADPAPLMLDTLMELGPEGATELVGATLLENLVALHADVFASFPALQGKHVVSGDRRKAAM